MKPRDRSNEKSNFNPTFEKKDQCTQTTNINTKENPIEPQNIEQEAHTEIKKWQCQHCYKTFSTNSNMHKHVRKSCKEYKLKQENERLREENRILQSHIIPMGNTINNITNNNNTQNNTQNITINAYGKEDLQYLLPKIPMLIRHFPVSAVTDLICETYYDPEHPENKSVKIRSTNP